MLKFSLPTAWSRSPFPLSALEAADFPSLWESPSFLAVSSLSPPSCCPSPTMGSSKTLPPPLLPDLHSAPMGFHPLCASSKGTQDTHPTVQASSKLLLIHPEIQPMFIACLLPGTLSQQQQQRSCFPRADILAEGSGNEHGNKYIKELSSEPVCYKVPGTVECTFTLENHSSTQRFLTCSPSQQPQHLRRPCEEANSQPLPRPTVSETVCVGPSPCV